MSLQDNVNSTMRWGIHRPLHGWYIRLRNVLVPLFTYHQVLSTTFQARPSSPAAPTSHPPPHAATGCLASRAYQAHRTTRPRPPKLHSDTAPHSGAAVLTDALISTRADAAPSEWTVSRVSSIAHAKLGQLAQCPRLAIFQVVLAP